MTGSGSLVIVESPAKARTIEKYLGRGYTVRASVGHVRDLPKKGLGVDVEAGFEPRFVTVPGKEAVVRKLTAAARKAARVVLATDPDREGEAIAYHVALELGYGPDTADGRFVRVRFHEVTRDAVRRALESPEALDMRRVEAQQARRILDRLVGYQVSPMLWRSIRRGLSAGRVQTVALRLIVEREEEIRGFVPREYWSVTARLAADGREFEAKLHHIDGKKLRLDDEAAARRVVDDVAGRPFVVGAARRRERRKNPPAPFTTSTLQQEAAKRLGFDARRTMRVAQQLYEGVRLDGGADGLITYMRTDSTRVAPAAAAAAVAHLRKRFGAKYVAASPRTWGARKQKGAQNAHEAIRPTDPGRAPAAVRRYLSRDQYRLYELIWLRFMAGQMKAAVYDTTTLDFPVEAGGRTYLFRAAGSVLRFDGFTRLYQEAREDGDPSTLDDLPPIPALEKGSPADLRGLEPARHFTKPPARFTEASLVKELERLGIGRPSTYAQILSTLRDRDYVRVEKKRFEPTPLGETVAGFLVRVFPDLFDVGFTSGMEAALDRVEEGGLDWRRVLADFYGPFREQLERGRAGRGAIVKTLAADGDGASPAAAARPAAARRPKPEPTGEACPECGGELVRRTGRHGPFIGCAGYPRCRFTRPETLPGLRCPKCGEGEVGAKRNRRGTPFWGCTRYPACDWLVSDRPVAVPCPTCGAPFLVVRHTEARGDYYRCPGCRSEMSIDAVGPAPGAAGEGQGAKE